MENATQALLIVGGILLAILTLTLLVYMFNNLATMENAQAEKKEAERLSEWNAGWEAYNKKVLYGAEVLTVINKAEQNNKEYDYSENYKVNIHVYLDGTEQDKNFVAMRKSSIFECTSLVYNDKTGRVKEMSFKFVE